LARRLGLGWWCIADTPHDRTRPVLVPLILEFFMSVLPSALPARRQRNLAELVVEFVNGQIETGALKPGDKLPTESELMRVQGVSRTVVREAISRLQAAEVIATRHGIGSFVLEPKGERVGIDLATITTLRDVLSILELRISLETECAGLAAQRASREDHLAMRNALDAITAAGTAPGAQARDSVPADLQFHLCIARSTGNRYFVDILSQLGAALIPRTRIDSPGIAHVDAVEYVTLVNREHENIYEAILRSDSDAARAAMRMHLSNSRERLRRAHQLADEAALAR
jgi:DNA-binding FadR family transcriptional regulator